jgi:hypothetical protein
MKTLALAALVSLLRVPATAGPVVLELFTSQGCSSCPGADRLLSTWGAEQFRAGRALPLSFDVDYWNYLGWRDVFSAPRWSERQSRYAAALGERTYTPQLVVAGRRAFVGSDAEQARAALERFSGEPARAALAVRALPSERAKLEVSIEPTRSAAGLHAVLALFESGLVTQVARGENAGRALKNDFVVRQLVDLGPVTPGKTFLRRLEQPWDASWKKQNSGAAVFLQDPKTLAVYDAASAAPLR